MKCIKNVKSGEVVRVSDKIANNTVGRDWAYISKLEWKTLTRKPVVIVEEAQEETVSEKQLKRRKNK